MFEVATVYSALLTIIENNPESVSEILRNCIQSNDKNVEIAATKALCSIMSSVNESLLPSFLETFDLAIEKIKNSSDPTSLGRVADVTEKYPRI